MELHGKYCKFSAASALVTPLSRLYSASPSGAAAPRRCFYESSHPVLDERTLSNIEKESAAGLTSAEILDLFARHAIPLSEATLRKYVQLGLLPRSIRVGRKGKHQGSQGVYPVNVVRQILTIKRM